MSLALKKSEINQINLFSSIIYHVSFCIFLSLLILRNAAIAIEITIYVTGDIISTFAKQFIMIATERSAGIAKSCLVLVEFLAMNYIKYIDFVLDEEQKQKVSSEQNSIKTILANASKRVQTPAKKDVPSTPNTPIISADILKKSDAVRQSTSAAATEASPALSMFAELSLMKAEKNQLPLERRHRPSIPSSLGPNLSGDWESTDFYPSRRYSTPASEKPKRTTTMKLINSTAANRVLKSKKRVKDNDEGVVEESTRSKSSPKQKPQLREKNLNLYDERPTLSQPPRTIHLNKTPEMNLQVARKHLKVVIKIRKHRNTI